MTDPVPIVQFAMLPHDTPQAWCVSTRSTWIGIVEAADARLRSVGLTHQPTTPVAIRPGGGRWCDRRAGERVTPTRPPVLALIRQVLADCKPFSCYAACGPVGGAVSASSSTTAPRSSLILIA